MLSVDGGYFKDEWGRTVLLRGVNFAADIKQPRDGVANYVNNPCTLEEADEHFTRIKALGFNCVRFLYTWDAIQPDHPDTFNEAYIDHLISLVRKAIDEYKFYVFMDPHQDIWSRFSGGSGAPLWTLHAAGFDPDYFNETHAAILWDPKKKHQIKMQWASNYHRLVCQTMFTLFFAGEEFAPKALINGMNVGTYLKTKFFDMVEHIMQRFNDADLGPNLLGWESINEPGHGLIGYEHLDEFPKSKVHVKLGTAPTPFQAMLLGQGVAQRVGTYKFTGFGLRKVEDDREVRPSRGTWLLPDELASLDKKYGWNRSWPGGCIWELHGVYDLAERKLLKPGYFKATFRAPCDSMAANSSSTSSSDSATEVTSNTDIIPIVEAHSHVFVDHYYVQHWFEFAALVTKINPQWLHFMQAPVNAAPPNLVKHWAEKTDFSRLVYTPHFYDGLTLLLKRWRWLNVDAIGVMREVYKNPLPALRFGDSQIGQSFFEQFLYLKTEGQARLGKNTPLLMSEIGIPYDMDRKNAYISGYWDNQIRAMDANTSALEKAKLNYTLWCYSVTNSHELGDNFAGEDLSIYSKDDETDDLNGNPENGVRAAASVIRPGPIAVAGDLVETHFNLRRAEYKLTVTPQPMQGKHSSIRKPQTLVFIPKYHFPNVIPLINANVTQGKILMDEEDDSKLIWDHGDTEGVTQTLVITGMPRFHDSAYSYVEGIHKAFRGLVRHLGSCLG